MLPLSHTYRCSAATLTRAGAVLQLEPLVLGETDGVLGELRAKESELQDHLIFRQVFPMLLQGGL